jgi:phage gp29-like protein
MIKLNPESIAQLLPVVQEIEPTIDRITDAGISEDGVIVCTAQAGKSQFGIRIEDSQIEAIPLDDTAQFSSPEQPDPIDPILTQLKPIGDATFAEWFTQLRDLMDDSKDLVEFRDRLTDAYPNLDSAQFKSAMLDASTIAGMRGYLDAG